VWAQIVATLRVGSRSRRSRLKGIVSAPHAVSAIDELRTRRNRRPASSCSTNDRTPLGRARTGRAASPIGCSRSTRRRIAATCSDTSASRAAVRGAPGARSCCRMRTLTQFVEVDADSSSPSIRTFRRVTTARFIEGVKLRRRRANRDRLLRASLDTRDLEPRTNVTNYVPVRARTPLHAFYAKAKLTSGTNRRHAGQDGRIVRHARQTTFRARSCLGDIVIRDGPPPDKALRAPGVMGGLDNRGHRGDDRVLLESASFSPRESVSHPRGRLNLPSEASLAVRPRCVDPISCVRLGARSAVMCLFAGWPVAGPLPDALSGEAVLRPAIDVRIARVQMLPRASPSGSTRTPACRTRSDRLASTGTVQTARPIGPRP